LSALTFHCHTAGPGGSRSCRSLTLSNRCSLDSSPYLQTHVVLRSSYFQRQSCIFSFVRCSSALFLLLLPPVLSRHRERLLNSCQQCRYHHRHIFVFSTPKSMYRCSNTIYLSHSCFGYKSTECGPQKPHQGYIDVILK
jgi:hypothetical protein